jgi:hypothetical protein
MEGKASRTDAIATDAPTATLPTPRTLRDAYATDATEDDYWVKFRNFI